MPQPDRWPASAPDPRAPKSSAPQRDWSQAPWSDVAVQAATHVIPSYAGDLWNSAVGLAKHVTAPATPGTAGSANEPVSMGLIRGLSDRFLGTNTQQGRTTGADFARGAGEYLGSRYGSAPALKRTLATDPGGVLMDAQAAASVPEGGEGFLGRVPGLVGDVARPVGASARTFNKFTNPATLAGAGLKTAAAATRTALKGGQVLDKTGAFTPAVQTAVQRAFPNGEITAADLANPKFKAQLVTTLTSKGITPAAVKEATLAYHGAPTALATVTRTRAAPNVADTVADANTKGRQVVGAKMASIVGGPPDPATLGASVEQAHDQSLAAAGQNYTDLKRVPGSFGPTLNGPDLNAHIGAQLASKDMPSTPALLQRSANAYPEANAALDLVNDSLVNGKTRLGGDINTPEIAEVRRQLGQHLNAAKGSDKTAVGAIIDGLHDHLESTSAQGNFVGPNGPVDISGQLRAANAAYKQHFDTFGNSQGPARVIKNAVASIKGSADAGVTGADAQAAGARTIASNLANPTQGPATYAVVKNALGPQGQPVLDDYMRKAAVMAPDGSVLPTDKLRANLSGPSAGLFTPGEQSDLRIGAAAQDVLDAKAPPGAKAPPNPGSIARRVTAGAVGAGAATLAAPLLPHFPFAEAVASGLGAGAGMLSEGLIEPHFHGEAVRAQLAGAPEPGQFLNRPEDIGRWTEAAGPAIPLAHAAGEMQPNPPLNFTFPAVPAPEVDLSAAPGPYDAAPAPVPEPTRNESKDRWPSSTPPPGMANAPAPVSAPADTEDLSSEPGPYDQPVARASGGKVDGDIERLVTRLQNLAKHAKAQSKKQTEPLLRVPDAAITKALDVAQRAI